MSEKKNGIVVGGFYFVNAEEGEQAKKEAAGVRYLREKTDMNAPESVLSIYNKMVQQTLFETAVGYVYLKELQEFLHSAPEVDAEKILPIPVQHPAFEGSVRAGRAPATAVQPQPQNFDFRKRYRASVCINIVLLLCIVGMFVVGLLSNSPTILNYESKIIDRYEQWEQELEEREAALEEREKGIGQN